MRKLASILLGTAAVTAFIALPQISAQQQSTQEQAVQEESAQEQAGQAIQLNGHYVHEPWDRGTDAKGLNFDLLVGAASGTIPMFNYVFSSPKDNVLRTGTMAGTSPFAWIKTGSNINTVIVPVKVTIGSAVFDPTAPNSCDGSISALSRLQKSPLVQNVPNLTINGINVGTTQWINGFRRAEFWDDIVLQQAAYQNTLNFSTAALVSISAGSHGTTYSSGCTRLGIVSYSWLSAYLKNTLLPALTASHVVDPTKFVIFLLRDVVQSEVDPPSVSNCCILGFHGATGSPVQTYSPMDWDTTNLFTGVADASIASHEIAEWMDDPLGNSPTPTWGNIGQVSGCQTNLEVGDPLSGTLMPGYVMNGTTYHMQELAFSSWFLNKPGASWPYGASLGAGGKFSSNGTFKGPSKACLPGGTY